MLEDVGLPEPFIDQWRCTLAMCRRAAAPESLAQAAQFFGLDLPKDPRGKALIGIFSDQTRPVKLVSPTGEKMDVASPLLVNPVPWDWKVKLHGAGVEMTVREAWELFKAYCRQDVRVEQELHKKLAHFELKGDVLDSFQFDLRMNSRGVPVNVPALKNAQSVVKEITSRLSKKFTAITGVAPSRNAATLAWLKERGYQENDLQAATVRKVMANPEGLTPEAAEALRLRDMISYAALKKIPTMIAAACPDDYVRGTMQWHAARTGRAGGRIIQPQNFRKSTIGGETELCYKLLCDGADADTFDSLWESPLEAIASSIRHFIQPHEGGMFYDCDYAGVEARVVAWIVGDEAELQKIVEGVDMYKDMASKMFKVPYDEVTKSQRTIAKPIVLGCGFGVGGKAARKSLDTMYGVKRTLAECKEYVRIYRDTHPETVSAWRELEAGAKNAVISPGATYKALAGKIAFKAGRIAGVNYLTMRLPSGRRLYYPDPKIKEVFRKYDEEDMEEDPRKREEKGYWVEELSFYGKPTGKQVWGRIGTYGSRLLENAVQAAAADLLVNGCLEAEKEGFDIRMIIHDQILALHDGRPVEALVEPFCRLRPWAEGFPLEASGDVVKFYTKN
jgi:DNA polymerase bacteriophage-type